MLTGKPWDPRAGEDGRGTSTTAAVHLREESHDGLLLIYTGVPERTEDFCAVRLRPRRRSVKKSRRGGSSGRKTSKTHKVGGFAKDCCKSPRAALPGDSDLALRHRTVCRGESVGRVSKTPPTSPGARDTNASRFAT